MINSVFARKIRHVFAALTQTKFKTYFAKILASKEGEKMVEIRPMEEIVRRKARGSLEAFLNGDKNLKWAKREIETSGVLRYEGMLKGIFSEMRRYEESLRYKEILIECQKEGWV